MSANCSINQVSCGFYDSYCIDIDQFNCDWYRFCYCPPLEANPDIAGPGVIAAFIASAALTLIASILYLLLRPVDHKRPTINLIDRWLRSHVAARAQNWTWIGPQRSKLWADCLRQIVLNLSDQQLVTGLAILIAAWVMFHKGTISVLHFDTAMNLAWFSSNTHLLSLLVLRDYLRSEDHPTANGDAQYPSAQSVSKGKSGFPAMRIWRALCMVSMAGMLLAGTVVSGNGAWGDEGNCPAKCVGTGDFGRSPLRWMITNIVMIAWSYPVQLAEIFGPSRRAWRRVRRFNSSVDAVSRDALSSHRTLLLAYNAARVIVLAAWYLFASVVFEILFQISWFAIGVWSMVDDIHWGRDLMDGQQRAKENDWGFGQLVPVILLMLPFMVGVEVYHEKKSSVATEAESEAVRWSKKLATVQLNAP